MSTFLQAYQQAEQDFQQLCSKTRNLNLKVKIPVTDKRHGALQSLMKICMWKLMDIRNFINYGIEHTSILMTTFNLSRHDALQFANSVDILLRASFLSLFMFQTENLLRMIRDNLSVKGTSNKYYNICEDVLKVTHPKDWKQKHNILQISAYLRNCLHNSGMHTNPSKSFTIRNVKYDFVQNQMFSHATWSDIVIFIEELVDVLEEVLIHSKVKKLSIPK